jgi:hypothetical protein
MNGRVHHYMRIASSTMQNCSISYFIFDDIASLASSTERQNVDPTILSDICQGLKNENTYCHDLCFLGIEAQQHAEGNIVIPRMVDQVKHFDVCSVVNNRQTGAMMFQVRTRNGNVSDINTPMCHSSYVPFPFCHSAILPFCHSAIPPKCHSAILPFCHSTNLPLLQYTYIHTQCQHSPMSGDAWEYLILLRRSLLAEVKLRNNEYGDFDGDLKNSLSMYWGMFTSGLTEQRVQCTLCKGVTEEHNIFDDLILNFEQSHHVNNHKNNRCTLGEMLTYHSKNQDDILDYKCVNCYQRT